MKDEIGSTVNIRFASIVTVPRAQKRKVGVMYEVSQDFRTYAPLNRNCRSLVDTALLPWSKRKEINRKIEIDGNSDGQWRVNKALV